MSGFVIELGFLIGLFAGGLAVVLIEDLAIRETVGSIWGRRLFVVELGYCDLHVVIVNGCEPCIYRN
jgi:hypothetical protein